MSLGLGFVFIPPFVLECWGVCVGVRAPPVPCPSRLGCAVCLCVLGLGFGLRPAITSWGVGVCVCARPQPLPQHSCLGSVLRVFEHRCFL